MQQQNKAAGWGPDGDDRDADTVTRDRVHSTSGNGCCQIDAALRYAARGWAVFPARPRGKEPLAPRGFHDATTNPAAIRAWWRRWPDANIGIATGDKSGLLVVDVDAHHGALDGAEALNALERRFGPLPKTICALTGGGGMHFYFRCPPGARSGKLADGVDVKAEGGYVIAPPSVHPSGEEYVWDLAHHPDDTPLADPPAWLLDLLAKRAPAAPPLPETIKEGKRNITLASLAGSMRRRGASESAILAALLEENARRCDPPLPDREVRAIAASVARYAPAEAETDRDLDAEQKDYGHAMVLGRLFQGRYRWATHRGCWMEWTGQVWQPTEEARVALAAAEALRAEYAAEIATTTDRARLASLAKRVTETCVYARITGALSFLKGWPGILTTAKEWDADPWLLNVGNGILDLRNGELHPHTPDALQTKLAPVDYDPEADCTKWQAHLERFLPNPNIRRQVQRDLGLALVGAVLEESLPIWYGTGANGKTTTARVVQRVLGDYARKAAPDLLMSSRYERHPTEVADLHGSRLVFSVEADAGRRLAEALVKDLTGGDTKKARFMRQDFFEFEQTFSIVLVVNHKPIVTGTDDGIWRRIRLVPWEYQITDNERRPQDEVVAELAGPAVLNWLLAGLADWQADHHWIAPEVQAATQEYRAEQDVLGAFLAECCDLGPRFSVGVGELYQAYVDWANGAGEDPLGKTKVGELLRRRGISQRRGSGGGQRRWVGIRLKTGHGPTPSDGSVTKCDNASVYPHAKTKSSGEYGNPVTVCHTPQDDSRCAICGGELWAFDPDGRPLCQRHALEAGIVEATDA